MALEVFKKRERAYLQWLNNNPSGFVVNTQEGNCSYFTLHKSNCRAISKSTNPKGAFTERNYFKVCADNTSELKNWFTTNNLKFHGEFDKCGICNPNDSDIFHKSLCLFPETIEKETTVYKEGVKKQITVNSFERNPKARQKCLSHYGYSCSVCGILFEDIYTQIGKNFIHVHHMKEISEIGDEYKLDPIADLRPFCPNCLAMIHQRKPCFTIEEMKVLYHPKNC